MKKIIFLLAMLQASLLSAAGNDLVMMQRLPDDSSAINRIVTKPAGSSDGLLGFLGSTQRPSMIQLGQGLSLSGGVLSSTVATGPTGPAGPQGVKGDQGIQGVQGVAGAKGDTGTPGSTGATGPRGETGLTGSQGIQGIQGLTGAAGPKGDQGAQGLQGPQGLKGDTGLTGSTGPASTVAGPQGIQGLPGEKGDKGDTGAQGVAGTAGALGATGATGPQGPVGLTGAQGAQGPIGLTGATGPAGTNGTNGTSAPIPTTAAATRALNTAFQPSTTRPVLVSYAVDVSVTSLLLTGAQGTATLQYADNSAMTTNLVTVDGGTNATGGVLNVTNTGTVKLTALIPAGKYARITTTTNSGSPTFTYRAGNETSF